jgi:cellulose synthase/poly-beta-1,6-N-acetylglucosamine synthase-like glycosyltransferase
MTNILHLCPSMTIRKMDSAKSWIWRNSQQDVALRGSGKLVVYLRSNRDYNCSFTNKPAIPIPVPMHILVRRIFFFCLLHSLKPVTICLAPVVPRG